MPMQMSTYLCLYTCLYKCLHTHAYSQAEDDAEAAREAADEAEHAFCFDRHLGARRRRPPTARADVKVANNSSRGRRFRCCPRIWSDVLGVRRRHAPKKQQSALVPMKRLRRSSTARTHLTRRYVHVMSIHVSMQLFIHVHIHVPMHRSIRMSMHVSTHMAIHMTAHMSVHRQ